MMEISKRNKIISSIVIILLFAAVFHISAESVWEGSAAMGRYGEFPFTGYYGASNSFPQNAFVEIENLENGKRARVIVVDRLSDSGLLMLVSNEAAQELGIYQSDIARIKVRMISSGSTAAVPKFDDLAYNPDPDLNPAAALMTAEELAAQETFDSERTADTGTDAEPVTVPEAAAVSEPEPEAAAVSEPESDPKAAVVLEPEPEPEAVAVPSPEPEYPPRTDGLSEAEILIAEKDVPVDIAADAPEKPYDWPDSLLVKPVQEPLPEPLYLTMDDFDEGSPLSERDDSAKEIHSPETAILWPDGEPVSDSLITGEPENARLSSDSLADASPLNSTDSLGKSGMELPTAVLELLSSGLDYTMPVYSEQDSFKISMLPEIIEKSSKEDIEYITDATDYYSPAAGAAEVSRSGLPAPEPEIPVEVIAYLVGDDILIAESEPENIEIDSNYIDTPEIITSGDEGSYLLAAELNEAFPTSAYASYLTAEALPELPGMTDSRPVEVADGYILPGREEFTGKISDYPDYAGANEPAEIPVSDEELAYVKAPETVSEFPDMTELPEVVSSGEAGGAEVADVEPAIPEYDENLEVTLVPAEVRPPELIEDETGLIEGEPDVAGPIALVKWRKLPF